MTTDQITIVRADDEYLKRHLADLHRCAEKYHDKAGERTHTADKLIVEFFKNIDQPNSILIVVEESGIPSGFLFGLAHERLAFLNAAYLGLKNPSEGDTIKQDCLKMFDDWALSLKCEEACFTTFRGPYAHAWAERLGWDYQVSVFHKSYGKSE